MTVLHIDFETRSTVELKDAGVDNYAKHPTTDAWCMAAAVDDGEPVVCEYSGDLAYPWLGPVLRHVQDGGTVIAHNAAFELAIWNHLMVPRYRWPVLKAEQCRCTMAQAYAMALPGSLEKAAAAVGIAMQKDMAGYRLMMQMAKPRSVSPSGEPQWWDDADKRGKLYEYCKQDVRVEQELHRRLMPLSDDEQALWVLDQTINNRGVYVDRESVQAAIAIVQAEQDRLNQDMRRVTGNFVGFCTETARIAKWVQSRGVQVEGVAKADVLDALELPDLPADVRAALLLRQEAGKSSTAKLRTMVAAASGDGRLRGMFQYHGAGTGRWAGRKVQLQNMPRSKVKHDVCHRAIEARDFNVPFESPLDIVSWSLKGFLTAAPGHDLLAADASNIEGRGIAWLAGEEWKLNAFRAYDAGTGPDLYLVAAGRIYDRDASVFSEDGIERQHGKVAELACGYQGGVGAFQKMAKNYLIKVADDLADNIKEKWRAAHPSIVQYWYDLEAACFEAVCRPGTVTMAGPKGRNVKFRVSGSFLWLLLPSGRVLCYPYPRIKPKETPWGEMKDQVHYMTVDGTTKEWVETHTYGGKLSENITQAICRDLLVSAIRNVEAAGYPVVIHVHDEVVAEVPEGAGSLDEFKTLCSRTPAWAAGLPAVWKGWRGRRYRK